MGRIPLHRIFLFQFANRNFRRASPSRQHKVNQTERLPSPSKISTRSPSRPNGSSDYPTSKNQDQNPQLKRPKSPWERGYRSRSMSPKKDSQKLQNFLQKSDDFFQDILLFRKQFSDDLSGGSER